MSTTAVELPLIPGDGYVLVRDASGLIASDFYEDGTFKASGLREGQMTAQKFKKRGRGWALRRVEDQDVPFSLEITLCGFTGGSDANSGTVLDAFRKKGAWAAAVSTSANRGDVHTLQVEFYERTSNLGASADAVLVMKYCDGELDIAEGVPGKLGVSGTAYVFGDDEDSVSLA